MKNKNHFDVHQKISMSEIEKIVSIVDGVYDRNKEMVDEWNRCERIRYNLILSSKIDLVDVYRQTNTIFGLCGKEQPFKEIASMLEQARVSSLTYLDSHEEGWAILRMYDCWHGSWTSDPKMELHGRFVAIGSINLCINHDVFTDKELSLLSAFLAEDK